MELSDFLKRQAARPFRWGEADCGLFIADWILEQRGVDPCAETRGGYETAEGAAENYRQWGGLARAVGRQLRAVGLSMTRTPQLGDVAVVVLAGHLCCAIRTALGWALRLETGMALMPASAVRLIAAWKV